MRSDRTDGDTEELPVIAGRSPSHGSPPSADASTFPAAAADEVFRVTGMDCSDEVAAIERALKPVPGVISVRAEIVAAKVTVIHDGKLSRSVIAEAINKSGVTVHYKRDGTSGPSTGAILLPPLVSLPDSVCCCNGLDSRTLGSLTPLFSPPS